MIELLDDESLHYLKEGYELRFYPARQSSHIVIRVDKGELCLSKIVNFKFYGLADHGSVLRKATVDALRELRGNLSDK